MTDPKSEHRSTEHVLWMPILNEFTNLILWLKSTTKSADESEASWAKDRLVYLEDNLRDSIRDFVQDVGYAKKAMSRVPDKEEGTDAG